MTIHDKQLEELKIEIAKLQFANKLQRDFINDQNRCLEIYRREFKIPKDFHMRKSVFHRIEKNKFVS